MRIHWGLMRAIPGAPRTGALWASKIVPNNLVTNRQEADWERFSDPSMSAGKGQDGPQSFPSPAPEYRKPPLGGFFLWRVLGTATWTNPR